MKLFLFHVRVTNSKLKNKKLQLGVTNLILAGIRKLNSIYVIIDPYVW